MIITVLCLVVLAFLGGFFAGVKNASSSKVAKAKAVIDELKK